MPWPEVVELRDIVIAPLVFGSSKRQMRMAAEPPSSVLEHYRYGRPGSVLKILPLSQSDATDAEVIEEPIIYGGLMFRHFGHALSEGIHRLWPRFALKELHPAKVAFSLVHNTKIMPYVSEALNIHGISRNQVVPIDRTIQFRRLFVGLQARQMAGPTLIPGYQTMLDDSLDRRLPPPSRNRRLYISRMHHHHTGSYYGESFVEKVLAVEGFEVIYPERHTLTDLVTMLRDSSIAVFAEGSAVHALELCGSITPAVFVIARRPGSTDRFAPLLSNICHKWMVSDHWLLSAGMSVDPKKHSGALDLPMLINDLWSFAGLGPAPVDHAAEREAVHRDLDAHIADERNDGAGDYEARARDLRQIVGAITRSISAQ